MNGTECYNLCPSNSSYCPPPVCFTLPPIPNPPHQQPSRDNSHVIIVIAFLVSTFILLSLCALAKHSSSRNTSTPTSAAPPTNNSTHQDHGPRQDPTHHTVDVESQRVVDTDVRSGGLEVSLIESITVCRYKRGDGLVEGTECSICLVEFRENEKLRFLPSCTHAFHPPCIDTWLRSNVNCPLCRRNIIPNPWTMFMFWFRRCSPSGEFGKYCKKWGWWKSLPCRCRVFFFGHFPSNLFSSFKAIKVHAAGDMITSNSGLRRIFLKPCFKRMECQQCKNRTVSK